MDMVETEMRKTVLADETCQSVICSTHMAARGKKFKQGAARRPASSFSRRPFAGPRPGHAQSDSSGNGRPGANEGRADEKPEVNVPHPPGKERSAYDGDTAIKLYLREIGQVKLLTPEEEIELAARIKKGDKKAREQMIKA